MRSQNVKHIMCIAAACGILLNGVGASATTLFGGVNHSDFLAPVDPMRTTPENISIPQVSAPQQVSPSLGGSASATIQNPAIEWFPIPSWLAGRWTKSGDLTKTVTDLRTGITSPVNEFIEDHMTVTWGYQTDSQGNVWHAHLIPTERIGESQGKTVSFLIVNLKVLEATPQNLVTRTHYIVRESMGPQLADIFQQESLTHYELVGSRNKMDAVSSNRVFSYQGQPKRDGAMVSHYDRTANFEPIASKQGVDLAASLNQYLRSHNLAGLAKQVQAVTPIGQYQPAQGYRPAQAAPTEGFQRTQGMQQDQGAQSAQGMQPLQGAQPLSPVKPVEAPLKKIDINNPF